MSNNNIISQNNPNTQVKNPTHWKVTSGNYHLVRRKVSPRYKLLILPFGNNQESKSKVYKIVILEIRGNIRIVVRFWLLFSASTAAVSWIAMILLI